MPTEKLIETQVRVYFDNDRDLLPEAGHSDDSHPFTIEPGWQFARCELHQTGQGNSTARIKHQPKRGDGGSQFVTVAWQFSPFGRIRYELKIFAEPIPARRPLSTTPVITVSRRPLPAGVTEGAAFAVVTNIAPTGDATITITTEDTASLRGEPFSQDVVIPANRRESNVFVVKAVPVPPPALPPNSGVVSVANPPRLYANAAGTINNYGVKVLFAV